MMLLCSTFIFAQPEGGGENRNHYLYPGNGGIRLNINLPFVPYSNGGQSLGSIGYKWNELWTSGVAYLGNTVMNTGATAVTSFAGTVSSSGTTVTFSSAADAILAGYSATNPVLGTTIIAGAQTRYIQSWTNATTAVVGTAPSPVWSTTAITSTQFPINVMKTSAGANCLTTYANGDIQIGNGAVGDYDRTIYFGTDTNPMQSFFRWDDGDSQFQIGTIGAVQWRFDNSTLKGPANGPGLASEVGSVTNPTLIPIIAQKNYGVGGDGTSVNLIANGLNILEANVTGVDITGNLAVSGEFTVGSDSTGHDMFVGNATYSYMDAGAGWTTSSDIALKENIASLSTIIDKSVIAQKILTTPLYRYNFKKESLGWEDASGMPDQILVEDSVQYQKQILTTIKDTTESELYGFVVTSRVDTTLETAYRDTTYYIPNPEKVRQINTNEKALVASAKNHFGFIAQEFGAVWENNAENKTINWQKVSVIQWYALQELVKEVVNLKAKYNDLDARLKKLE